MISKIYSQNSERRQKNKESVWGKRLIIINSEFFRDFDKLRSGEITNIQLRLGLNMGKMPLSDHEFNLIVDHFKSR